MNNTRHVNIDMLYLILHMTENMYHWFLDYIFILLVLLYVLFIGFVTTYVVLNTYKYLTSQPRWSHHFRTIPIEGIALWSFSYKSEQMNTKSQDDRILHDLVFC